MDRERHYLLKAMEIAKRSMEKGNLPFGCLLADGNGLIIEEGENTVITNKDNIAHCEINLVHQLAGKYEWEYLNNCTVYASTEPCPMCSGAIFWSGIGKIVFALSKEGYHETAGTHNPAYIFDMKSGVLLEHGGRKVKVIGPLMEQEAKKMYAQWLT
ncbi:MAG: nucleoside deaminase [Terrimonas sp.]|nr:nucleoside deaminase [Terrimonas sp.]